jgi:hypothetical protein
MGSGRYNPHWDYWSVVLVYIDDIIGYNTLYDIYSVVKLALGRQMQGFL